MAQIAFDLILKAKENANARNENVTHGEPKNETIKVLINYKIIGYLQEGVFNGYN